MATWVQHISGQGGKYQLVSRCPNQTLVLLEAREQDFVPCEPPEQWERVEVGVEQYCSDTLNQSIFKVAGSEGIGYVQFGMSGYRVVSLVVERRKP